MLIDWFTVTAQVINFLILVWLLKRFLYKPVLTAIDEREKRIATQLQDAEKKKAEALKEQAEFQHKNEEFDQQRVALLADAASAAKTEREKLIAAARQDAEALRAKLQKANSDEFENLNKKVGTFAQKEVLSIARKALTDLAGINLEESVAEAFLRRLHNLDDKQRAEFREFLRASSKAPVVRSAFNLSDPQKRAIADALKPLVVEGTQLDFETKPELISGIELIANGQKIAWNISDYLGELSAALGGLLQPKSVPAAGPDKALSHAA
jgi:F-type H+-transporting ATPase subunit b